MKIDAHQHFWKYVPEEYVWIDESMSAIRRDFMPGDLIDEIRKTGIDGTIAVQARQTTEETEWLMTLAEENDFISGIVGWVPLKDGKVEMEIERLVKCRKLKAVRHVIQEEPAGFFSDANFNRGIRVLKKYGLVYDILIHHAQLCDAVHFVDRHPEQIFVIDHMGKPAIKAGRYAEWQKPMRILAKRENVYCKISGIVTEADWRKWTIKDLIPYFESALDFFTPARLMFGSDWPVCLNACNYGHWKKTMEELIAPLSGNEKKQIMGMTAAKAYNLL